MRLPTIRHRASESVVIDAPDTLVLPLQLLTSDSLPRAGGKAANLGELIRAGLPVPPGLCVTTAAYDLAAAQANLGSLLEELAAVPADEPIGQATLAGALRTRILAAPVPQPVALAVRGALATLRPNTPLAVRSSATAEDLPFASFAGQQDTFLNVVGADAVLAALRACWASLWTDRAVAYRANNAVDPRGVRLAVVLQELVDARVAGVLFTANPLTGRRRQAVLDASPGLGEAVVSGAVNPDHFMVDTTTGAILERRSGDKRLVVVPAVGGGTRTIESSQGAPAACLSDAQLRALAQLGARAEAHFGTPQDVEFAVAADGSLWLTQARPITTLFPLPAAAPADDRDLRVYFNGSVAQGVFRPLTPMAQQGFRLIGTSLSGLFGNSPGEPLAGPGFVAFAAGRLFLDSTDLVRSRIGQRIVRAVLSHMEARSAVLLNALQADTRLSARPTNWRRVLPALVHLLGVTQLPLRVLMAFANPGGARRSAERLRSQLTAVSVKPAATATERLDHAERLLLEWPPRIFPCIVPSVVVGLGSFALASRLLEDLASPAERDALRGGLPHNPTTEMNLALWGLAQRVRYDAPSAAALRDRSAANLATDYQQARLPDMLQRELGTFLMRYGHRAVAEIDLGLPRWADDPSPLLSTLSSYLALDALAGSDPSDQFKAAALHAEATAHELTRRAARRSRLRGVAVRVLLGRGRALAGQRVMPKFLLVLMMAHARAALAPVGAELEQAGRLDQADDVFFLNLTETRAALAGADQRALVDARRAEYDHELRRRHLPRFLLSDGTEPALDVPTGGSDADVLRGTPASAGQVVGHARVILDATGARLRPGEILVAPSTDPGWTPLFLTASGLVMEMGGAMSHGAVVAREYGIPAVVGLARATERIADGQLIAVNGTTGTVTLKLAATGSS
jgi:phosphohistidine swiveling domain-containing protein